MKRLYSALHSIADIIDDVKEKISNDEYVRLMDTLKEAYQAGEEEDEEAEDADDEEEDDDEDEEEEDDEEDMEWRAAMETMNKLYEKSEKEYEEAIEKFRREFLDYH
jgi:hypothetical protein